jgi:hypothetical protein
MNRVVQEGMFHVEHQKRNGNSKNRGVEKKKNAKNLRQVREIRKRNSEVLQCGI